jgi:hypothetical protein
LLLPQERKEEELRLQKEALAHEQERKRQSQDPENPKTLKP